MIPNKEITKKQFFELIINNKLTFGGEAIICQSDNPYSLYKIFSKAGQPKPMEKNKEMKINYLYETKPDFCIQPINTISLDDIIIGYEMTADPRLKSYESYQLSSEELKYFLIKTRNILEYFSSLGIIYGDIKLSNILFNRDTGDIQFCDMDNIALNNNPMDLIPSTIQSYHDSRSLDVNIHPYMHNIMTLHVLDFDVYLTSKNKLRHYFKRQAIKTIESMKDPKNFDNQYIIQHLKKITR